MHSSVSFSQVPQVRKRHGYVTPNARSYEVWGDGKEVLLAADHSMAEIAFTFGFSLGACEESLGGSQLLGKCHGVYLPSSLLSLRA